MSGIFPDYAKGLFERTFLNDTVTIQHVTVGQSSTNGARQTTVSSSEEVAAEVHAIDPADRVYERVIGQFERNVSAYRVNFKTDQELDQNDRVVIGGRTCEIVAIKDQETNQLLKEVVCVEVRS